MEVSGGSQVNKQTIYIAPKSTNEPRAHYGSELVMASTKLLYIEPSQVIPRCETIHRYIFLVYNQPPRPTQPPTLRRMGNKYQSKCGDALRMESKGMYSSLHYWIKCVGSR